MKIYQLKPQFLDDEHQAMFYFSMSGVDPSCYLRVWVGDIGSDDPEKIYGRFHLNPPEDFQGRPLAPGDVLEINDQFHFISQEASGLEMHEINFDPAHIKPALFVEYGYDIEADGSNAMPVRYVEKALQLEIPIGINGMPDYHGSHKGEPYFNMVSSNFRDRYDDPVYLHPQFLSGAQAREYISAFTVLCDRSNWEEIRDELQKQTPLYYEDMLAAKEQYASLPEIKSLYRGSFNEAKQLNEIDEWRASQKENIRCRDFIDKAIGKDFDGFYLNGNIAEQAIGKFGHDRVQWVLANTIQHKCGDTRFSPQSEAWAQSIYIQRPAKWERRRDPHLRDDTRDYVLDKAPGLVEMVARDALKLYADLNLFNINHCEPGDIHTKNFEGKLLILRDTALKEAYRTPENQLFYATHGNGCNPNAIGRSVFGHFLVDGESAAFDRSAFLGVIDEDQTPKWAAVKLHDLQTSDAPDEAQGQSMKGV
jgi:hypothetical protein